MLYDANATDALFADGRPPREDLQEILAWARERLSLNGTRPWRLLSGRRKMGKTLFEIDEMTAQGPRRLIGKLGKRERVEVLERALHGLRKAGFRPPSRLTVTECVACLPERGFILQEKAPGVQALDLILTGQEESLRAAEDSAEWLAALQRTAVDADPKFDDPATVATQARELSKVIPGEEYRIGRIEDAIMRELAEPVRRTVVSHGDFHAMNIFIDGERRITGIDVDKLCTREPEADAGYFLSQTASFGFFKSGGFSSTDAARRRFLDAYTERAGQIRKRRVALHMALAFLKNLHFELVLLETGRVQFVEPWLRSAEQAILDEDLHLSQ